MQKTSKPIVAVIIAATALGLTACTQTAVPNSPAAPTVTSSDYNVITVQSSEKVKVAPDMAEIIFAVSSQAANAKTCQTQNSEDLNKVIGVLKEAGIEEKSIQTSNFGLDPVYDYTSGQELTGYEMRTTLTVSDLPIDKVGSLLTTCVDAGINSIDSVSYLSSQYEANYQEALKQAIAAAKAKAAVIAEAGGCTLGGIVNVEEYSNNQELRYSNYSSGAGAIASAEMIKNDMNVAPGEISIEAEIRVKFAIN